MKKAGVSDGISFFLVNKMMRFGAALLVLTSLGACADTGVKTDATYSDKNREEMYKHGSVLSENGGWDIMGTKDKKSGANNGLAVNAYLWRAALDTISFMPITSADPFGGVIITDWYSAPDAPDERAKLNVFILDRELRADGVKVTVFKQTREPKGGWTDATSAPTTASQLEETILTRARQLKLAKRER